MTLSLRLCHLLLYGRRKQRRLQSRRWPRRSKQIVPQHMSLLMIAATKFQLGPGDCWIFGFRRYFIFIMLVSRTRDELNFMYSRMQFGLFILAYCLYSCPKSSAYTGPPIIVLPPVWQWSKWFFPSHIEYVSHHILAICFSWIINT